MSPPLYWKSQRSVNDWPRTDVKFWASRAGQLGETFARAGVHWGVEVVLDEGVGAWALVGAIDEGERLEDEVSAAAAVAEARLRSL